MWDAIQARKDELGGNVIAVLNGDITDDNYHPSSQMITKHHGSIIDMAIQTLKPCLDVADSVFVIRGTEAHVGIGASLDETLAREIGAIKDENSFSWWWLPAIWGGVRFDIAHHPGFSTRVNWSRGTDALKIAITTEMDYHEAGSPLPDIVLRAHNHRYADSGGNYNTKAFVCSPWQLTTSFGHRIGYSTKVEPVGGLMFVCNNGVYEEKIMRYSPKSRGYWSKVGLSNV
jgi:hypothetical protein